MGNNIFATHIKGTPTNQQAKGKQTYSKMGLNSCLKKEKLKWLKNVHIHICTCLYILHAHIHTYFNMNT